MNNYTIQGRNLSNFFIDGNKTIASQIDNRKRLMNILSNGGLSDQQNIQWINDMISGIDNNEFECICELFSANINIKSISDVITYAQLIDLVLEASKEVTREQFCLLYSSLKHIDDKLYDMYENDPDVNKYLGAISVLNRVGNNLMNINNYYVYGIETTDGLFKTKIELYKTPTGTAVNEGVMFAADPNVDGFSIEKATDNEIERLVSYLRDKMYSSDRSIDNEVLIGHIDDIPKYTYYVLSSNSTDKNYLSLPYFIISQVHNTIRNNLNGLMKLYDVVDGIIDKLDDIVYQTFEAKEASDKLLSFLYSIQSNIAKEEYLIRHGDAPDETDPLVECGLGFIFETMPLDESIGMTDSECEKLYEAYQNPVILDALKSYLNDEPINEGAVRQIIKEMKEKDARKAERKKELEQYKEDLAQQREKDKLDTEAERQKELDANRINRKYAGSIANEEKRQEFNKSQGEAKYNSKLQKEERKQELAKEKLDVKYDRKLRREKYKREDQEKREQRWRDTKEAAREMGKTYIKSAARTAANIAKSYVSKFGIPGTSGVARLMVGGHKNATNNYRARAINDIQAEINELEAKLSNSNNNPILEQKIRARIEKLKSAQGTAAARLAANGNSGVVAINPKE